MQSTAIQSSVLTELSEEDSLIQYTVRDVLEREGAQERARHWWQKDGDFDRAIWSKLAELGLANMVGSAELGGIDAAPLTASVVAEEIGRAAAALPFEMHSAALRLLSSAGNGARFSSSVLTAQLSAASNEAGPALYLIPEGAVCDAIVLPHEGQLAVARSFDREPIRSLGMNRLANIKPDPAGLESLGPLSVGEVTRARTFATVLFASRMVGLGDWMLSQCVGYAASRVQFGRPIGSFQATQHKLSEMHISMAATRFLTRHAAMQLGTAGEAELETSRAKAFAGTTLWRVATEAHQIHGGVGFVLDHPLHLYFAQARGADSLFGSVREHHQHVGKAILSGGRITPNAMLGVA